MSKRSERRAERDRHRSYLTSLKTGKPCELCGIVLNHWQMQYDHVDPSAKRAAVSRLLCISRKAIDAEIAKCRLLCANCHADVTYRQANNLKYLKKSILNHPQMELFASKK